MIWTHWLLRLDDRCPGLCRSLVYRVCVDVASSVDASPSTVSLVD